MAKLSVANKRSRKAQKNPYRLVYGGGPGRGFAVSNDYALPQMAIAEAKALSLPGSYGGEVVVVRSIWPVSAPSSTGGRAAESSTLGQRATP